MAEKVEVVKEEFPEGYVLYIIRGFRGLGSLSIQAMPSSVGTSVGEGGEFRVRFTRVDVDFTNPPSLSLNLNSSRPKITTTATPRLIGVSVNFEGPRGINLSVNAEVPRIPPIKAPQLTPIKVGFNVTRRVKFIIDDEFIDKLPIIGASIKPVVVSFGKPAIVNLQLISDYSHIINHITPRGAAYEFRTASVTFAQLRQVSLGIINYELPSLGNATANTTAKSESKPPYEEKAGELSIKEIAEVEEVIDRVLFGLGRVVPDRALVIVARRIGGFGYIEFLKRVLREVYRVSIGGLPNPKHVSNIVDLRLLIPIEVGAGGRLFVIDLVSGNLGELLRDKAEEYTLRRVKDRLRELFSQGFGFVVIYGDDEHVSEFMGSMWVKAIREDTLEYHSTVPSPIEVNPVVEGLDAKSSREFYAVLASVMWGRVSKPIADYSGFGGFDEFVVWLEDGYWRALEGALRDFDIRLKVKPSAEGDEHSLESMSHYLTKATMVNYLIRELTEEFRSKGIEEGDARFKALDCVETEYQLGNVRFDVYVKPNCGSRLDGLVVEVETLYGTGTVVHKVLDTVESRVKAGVNRLWVVVPNPQATILLPQL
ncbi:hypothetical protein, partial [Caldivirga sp. MU80]|uniref:hypothetical protein n=1 Tax=Caldivirga sp. MU80 TaxID=1650354 RepID=UPI000A4E5A26